MKKNLKFLCKEILTESELAVLPTSFDVIGDILIFAQFPNELLAKEKEIGRKILEQHKNIKVVIRKSKVFSGVYRTPQYTVIAGQNRTETTYKESGCTVMLDVEKVYFSPRLGTERLRVAQQVKDSESVLVMFCGCAIYPLIIAKHARPKEIVGVEINPAAHQYGQKNIAKNKMENVITLINDDVRNALPALRKKFDRIVMPLPHTAENFLDIALARAKKKSIIHYYEFGRPDEFEKITAKIKDACAAGKKKCGILSVVKCGEFGPGIYRVCVDFGVD